MSSTNRIAELSWVNSFVITRRFYPHLKQVGVWLVPRMSTNHILHALTYGFWPSRFSSLLSTDLSSCSVGATRCVDNVTDKQPVWSVAKICDCQIHWHFLQVMDSLENDIQYRLISYTRSTQNHRLFHYRYQRRPFVRKFRLTLGDNEVTIFDRICIGHDTNDRIVFIQYKWWRFTVMVIITWSKAQSSWTNHSGPVSTWNRQKHSLYNWSKDTEDIQNRRYS